MDYKNSFNEYTHGMEASKQKILNDATYTSGVRNKIIINKL